MRVPLSFFLTQVGNPMTLTQKIQQLLLIEDLPIILTTENDESLETCHNEDELREALQRRGIE